MANYEVENNFDKNLGSFLETFIIQEKQSLINNLSGTKEDVAEFDEDLQKFKQREIGFYNLVLSKLHEYVGENTENIPIYLFFDIDETIAKLDFNWAETIRPSLKFLLSTLKQQYPTIHFALCSARWEKYVQKFMEEYPEYWFEVAYSSRKLSNDPIDKSWGESFPTWHHNKAHAMVKIAKKYPSSICILVDDVIWKPFEDKKMGIPIREFIFNGYPKARWLM